MSKRLLVLLAGVMAIALVVAGCGSSSDDSTTASLTKAQFLKQGNAICAKGNAEIEEGFESFSEENNLKENEEPSEAQFEEATEEVLIPAITAQLEELRDLGTPEGDEGEVDAILTGAEEAMEEVEEEPALAAEEGDGPFGQVNKEAREYGLTVCGEE